MDKGKVDNAIINLIGAFATYAVKDGDHSSLTKAELKELLQKEMRNTIGKADEARMDQIFRDLDDDKNGVVDFTEYVSLVVSVATAVHNFLTLPQ